MHNSDPHFQIATIALTALKQNTGLSSQEILSKLKEILDAQVENYSLPVNLFNPELSILEAVCKYLNEVYQLAPRKIGLLIDRETAVVNASIAKANKKVKLPFKKLEHSITIPTSVFKAQMGPLESITVFLKENYHLSLSEIGRLLHRDPRNIWQSVNNARRKMGESL